MLQRDLQFRNRVQQLVDAFLFAFAFGTSFLLRGNETFSRTFFRLDAVSGDYFYKTIWLYALILPLVPAILESQGFYKRRLLGSRSVMIWSLLRGCVLVTLSLVLGIYLAKLVVPRGVMTLFGVLSFGLMIAKEELLRLVLASRLAKAQYQRKIIIAGMPAEIGRLRQLVETRAPESFTIAAEFNLADSIPEKLANLLHEHSPGGVLVSARLTQLDRVESVIQLCELEGVEAWLVADFFATQIAHARFDEIMGHPLLVFRSTPEASWQIVAKTSLDLVGALILLIFSSPILLVIAFAIKRSSPGPVFFRQQRSGLNGTPFTIFKFRTMETNAEQLKHELAAMNEMSGPVFKITNDPRVTGVGRFLRKYSLDELPQLFNVLRGEMSLVGPRPLPVDEVKRFNDMAHRRRLSVKPGLTCIWQVSGRNGISDFKDWVRLDLEYIDNWSIWLDLQILLRTIPVVIAGTGAK